MNLERFKKLEAEVRQDLYEYINKTRTIYGFRPQYNSKVVQIRTDGTTGLKIKRHSIPGTALNPLLKIITPFKTDYTKPMSKENLQGYRLLNQFAWK